MNLLVKESILFILLFQLSLINHSISSGSSEFTTPQPEHSQATTTPTRTTASQLLARVSKTQPQSAQPSHRAIHSFPSSSSSLSRPPLYRAALIGFRCDSPHETTREGVSVIEANTPIRLTLFGEYFTPDTIVAFTTEFEPTLEDDEVDQTVAANNLNHNHNSNQNQTTRRKRSPEISSSSLSALGEENNLTNKRDEQPAATASSSTVLTTRAALNSSVDDPPMISHTIVEDPKKNRRRSRYRKRVGLSYDCTDFNRIISYRLTNENILSPNVATLTINLPELFDSISGGQYYYFCLKQRPLPLAEAANFLTEAEDVDDDDYHDDGNAATTLAGRERTSYLMNNGAAAGSGSNHMINQNGSSSLVWVHQGNHRWLRIKVEPPILSVANDCVLILLLLFLSAVTSGLNLGLMSLDMNELAVISSCGDQRERSYARTIVPVRERGNYLLCSLLLGNVMVNSTLTVILEEMTSGVVAVIGSTLAIVVLGEIVPQAFCARQGLAIGAKTIWLTYAFMILTFPLSYPISCLLDCVLGEEKGNVYDRERLMEFIKITGHHTQLEADEVAIISGALKLKKIKVDQIMTKIEDVFMLPIDCMLNRETIKRIIEKGYSRIPIYEFGDRKQIVALILAKDLAMLDPDDQVPLASMLMYCKHPLIFIEDTATLDLALNEFKTGKSHMAVVRQIYDDGEVDKYYEAIGIVTLEDVIEEVLQTEINDETDTLSDNRRKRRRTDAQVAQWFGDANNLVPSLGGDHKAPPPLPLTAVDGSGVGGTGTGAAPTAGGRQPDAFVSK